MASAGAFLHGSCTGNLSPVKTAPMLGTHKTLTCNGAGALSFQVGQPGRAVTDLCPYLYGTTRYSTSWQIDEFHVSCGMITEKFPEIAKLPINEKRLLLNELCEDIASSDQKSPDARIVAILEERWKAHESDPAGGLTLEEFRRRIGES